MPSNNLISYRREKVDKLYYMFRKAFALNDISVLDHQDISPFRNGIFKISSLDTLRLFMTINYQGPD